jgi:Chaperone of endosialidase
MNNRNTITVLTAILAGLACFELSPLAQAVVPAPDGGYPGGNTAEGQNSLLSLTTGAYNTAVGFLSLRSDAIGSYNTAVGAGALLTNIGGQDRAGSENTATGFGALVSNTTGYQNTATGALALLSNTTAYNNTAIGSYALFKTVASINTAIGSNALFNDTNGEGNTAIGFNALSDNRTGNFNIALGDAAGIGVTTADHVICIGSAGNNVNDSCFIANVFGATSSAGTAVYVNSNGRLGTVTSSRRFKEDIGPMGQASEGLYALEPVTFRYKRGIDPEGCSAAQFGLVAEDVEKVNPDLVVRDQEGKPYSVRYDQVNAMLLNEFLKEHRTVQELKTEIASLATTVKEQAAQIRKVSARLEVNESRSRTVFNDPRSDRGSDW